MLVPVIRRRSALFQILHKAHVVGNDQSPLKLPRFQCVHYEVGGDLHWAFSRVLQWVVAMDPIEDNVNDDIGETLLCVKRDTELFQSSGGDYWKNLIEVKRELEMELLAMEWMMLMIYTCSHDEKFKDFSFLCFCSLNYTSSSRLSCTCRSYYSTSMPNRMMEAKPHTRLPFPSHSYLC
ncbi:hypothetical protein VNO80_30584 [Phaseolus coccineus]|uniref:Uncharacterized protein n=1 Tax=Phaseolus coccineus TaxID=3886 RepID=A0AAN9LD11_PHACN